MFIVNYLLTLKRKILIIIKKPRMGFRELIKHRKMTLMEYACKIAGGMKSSSSRVYSAATKKMEAFMLEQYGSKTIRLNSVDKEFCLEYIRFLKNSNLSQNSKYLYQKILSIILNSAVRDGYIAVNPMANIGQKGKITGEKTEREYLTEEELVKLVSLGYEDSPLREAFLFSCFTGLRISDIHSLVWDEVIAEGNAVRLEKKIVKTGKPLIIPLGESAIRFLPDRKGASGDDHVFSGVPFSAAERRKGLSGWMKEAGINKDITFHCARHTFATLMITLGADLYTTSKLLGHSNVATTQIYAKIVDKKKVEAVHLADNVFLRGEEKS